MPAFQNFTADRMSLVTPNNSNGWNIPLMYDQKRIGAFADFLRSPVSNTFSPTVFSRFLGGWSGQLPRRQWGSHGLWYERAAHAPGHYQVNIQLGTGIRAVGAAGVPWSVIWEGGTCSWALSCQYSVGGTDKKLGQGGSHGLWYERAAHTEHIVTHYLKKTCSVGATDADDRTSRECTQE